MVNCHVNVKSPTRLLLPLTIWITRRMSCQNQKLFTLCEHLGSSPVCIWRSPYCSYFSLCSVLLFLFVFVLCRVKLSVSGWSSNSPLVYRPVWCVLKVVRVSEWSSNSPLVYRPVYYFTYFVPVFKYCYSDSRNLWTVMRAGGLAP